MKYFAYGISILSAGKYFIFVESTGQINGGGIIGGHF